MIHVSYNSIVKIFEQINKPVIEEKIINKELKNQTAEISEVKNELNAKDVLIEKKIVCNIYKMRCLPTGNIGFYKYSATIDEMIEKKMLEFV